MLEKIKFKNFKALKNAELNLGRFNLIVGPNGSGKSTVIQSLDALKQPHKYYYNSIKNILDSGVNNSLLSIDYTINIKNKIYTYIINWNIEGSPVKEIGLDNKNVGSNEVLSYTQHIQTYQFDANKMTEPVKVNKIGAIYKDGSNLTGYLDHIRDNGKDRFEKLVSDLSQWIPEFDDIGFDVPNEGTKVFKLRRKIDKKFITANNVSEGTLYTLAILALAHQSDSPSIICLEEPDRGLHPRLFHFVKDALYRLCYPEQFNDDREPIQVIATTHSPYFVDLFKDNPEQIIITDKQDDGSVSFKNLSKDPVLVDNIGEASLGEIWYSGILGGVPANT